TLGYLALAYGRAGQLDAVRANLRDALGRLEAMGDSQRTRTDEQWLRTYTAEAMLRCDAPGLALEVLAAPCVVEAMESLALPGLIARRWQGLAEIETGNVARGLSRLAAAPSQHPHAR